MLRIWLVQATTMPDLRLAILQRLTAWKKNEDTTPPTYAWPGVNDLVTAQDLVGWRAFLEGCVLQAWAAKQQDYYDWLERKNTGRRWVETLIKRLWQISWDVWEHRRGELKNPLSPALLREHARLDALLAPEYDDIRSLAKKTAAGFTGPKKSYSPKPLNTNYNGWNPFPSQDNGIPVDTGTISMMNVLLCADICTHKPTVNIRPYPTKPAALAIASSLFTVLSRPPKS